MMNLSNYAFLLISGYEQSFRTKFRIYHRSSIKKNKKNLSISPFPESLQERTRKEDMMRVIELYFPFSTPLHAHSHTHDANKGWKKK